jgi:hypothetical protein
MWNSSRVTYFGWLHWNWIKPLKAVYGNLPYAKNPVGLIGGLTSGSAFCLRCDSLSKHIGNFAKQLLGLLSQLEWYTHTKSVLQSLSKVKSH